MRLSVVKGSGLHGHDGGISTRFAPGLFELNPEVAAKTYRYFPTTTMDAKLEQLRKMENARLKKDRDQIITERNRYLAQKAELSSKDTEMSNQVLALESEINDLKRTNQDLTENLELALTTADRPREPVCYPLRCTNILNDNA
ncbi:hypothetical protein CPB85DRAFT_157339 [Mucidula mucida]|nr:hypothetical protein CPB85DRAFT_157339 [Mucidula mucida]